MSPPSCAEAGKMPQNQFQSDPEGVLASDCAALQQEFQRIVISVSGGDPTRTHFTFTNTGALPVYSVTVETIRHAGQTMDFEPIEELRPGASPTCLSIVHPVVANDPHWALDFRSESVNRSRSCLWFVTTIPTGEVWWRTAL
jgi:hypothetical protein